MSWERESVSGFGTFVVGIAVMVGLVGVVVPVLPGTLLVLAAIAVWAVVEGGVLAWAVLTVAVAAIGTAQVVKYVVPTRRLRVAGIPTSSLVAGGVLGIVGFFVVPVVGLFVGFPLGVYAAERLRLPRHDEAMASTRRALGAVGLSIVIELAGGLLAAGVWLTAVLVG